MKFVCALAFSNITDLCELARACEEAGFGGAAVSDHVVHPQSIASPYPYTADGTTRWEPFTDWPDPFVAIGALGAVTTKLEFLTSVYVLPMRSPFIVAKMAATADVISNGRLMLGIGVGWMKEEFVLLEHDFHTRGKRTNEMFEVMRKLWAGGWVEHHGEFYDFEPLEMSPVPKREIPILVGGTSKPAMRRAATLGDGWISDIHDTEELRGIIATLRELRAGSDRADRPFHVIASCSDAFDVDAYKRLGDLGVTHIQTMPWFFYGGETGNLQAQLDGIRRFGEDVVQKM